MIVLWFIVYVIAEILGNPTVHLDPMNGWGLALIISLALSVGSAT